MLLYRTFSYVLSHGGFKACYIVYCKNGLIIKEVANPIYVGYIIRACGWIDNVTIMHMGALLTARRAVAVQAGAKK